MIKEIVVSTDKTEKPETSDMWRNHWRNHWRNCWRNRCGRQ